MKNITFNLFTYSKFVFRKSSDEAPGVGDEPQLSSTQGLTIQQLEDKFGALYGEMERDTDPDNRTFWAGLKKVAEAGFNNRLSPQQLLDACVIYCSRNSPGFKKQAQEIIRKNPNRDRKELLRLFLYNSLLRNG